MPNVMAALPNIGGALYSTPQSKVWLTPTTTVPCSNAAKTRNPVKFAGVPQTNQTVSAASGPKFIILWGHVEEILLLNKFFFRLSTCALIAKILPNKVVQWCSDGEMAIFMVALCNRAGHYIFAMWFLSFYLSIFFPRLISAAADGMSTILRHMVWP